MSVKRGGGSPSRGGGSTSGGTRGGAGRIGGSSGSRSAGSTSSFSRSSSSGSRTSSSGSSGGSVRGSSSSSSSRSSNNSSGFGFFSNNSNNNSSSNFFTNTHVNYNNYNNVYSNSYSNSNINYKRNKTRKKFSFGDYVFTIIIGFLVFFLIFVLIGSSFLYEGITKSTVKREPLPKGSVNETEYFYDELGWIDSVTKLEEGMKYFYTETGVQPFIYITDDVVGKGLLPTIEELKKFANETYDKLFTDEAHLLLIFYEYDSQYATYCLTGVQAKSVVDTEGTDILLDYIDRYYYYSTLNESEFFSKSFYDSASRMMEDMDMVSVILFDLIIFIALYMIYKWRKKAKAKKKLEAENIKNVLNSDMEDLVKDAAEKLADKYENK